MEAVGVAANVIAIIDLSAKVASLLVQYSKDVKNAKDDIAQLHHEVSRMKVASESVQQLIEGPNGARLETSQKMLVALGHSKALLTGLEQKLGFGRKQKAMKRIGFRALKWPFESSDVAKRVQDLMRCSNDISLAIQIDQTYVLDST